MHATARCRHPLPMTRYRRACRHGDSLPRSCYLVSRAQVKSPRPSSLRFSCTNAHKIRLQHSSSLVHGHASSSHSEERPIHRRREERSASSIYLHCLTGRSISYRLIRAFWSLLRRSVPQASSCRRFQLLLQDRLYPAWNDREMTSPLNVLHLAGILESWEIDRGFNFSWFRLAATLPLTRDHAEHGQSARQLAPLQVQPLGNRRACIRSL